MINLTLLRFRVMSLWHLYSAVSVSSTARNRKWRKCDLPLLPFCNIPLMSLEQMKHCLFVCFKHIYIHTYVVCKCVFVCAFVFWFAAQAMQQMVAGALCRSNYRFVPLVVKCWLTLSQQQPLKLHGHTLLSLPYWYTGGFGFLLKSAQLKSSRTVTKR